MAAANALTSMTAREGSTAVYASAEPPSLTVRPAADVRRIGVAQVVLSLGMGGTERLVVELCERLQSRFAMHVCALDEPGVWGTALADRGVKVEALHRRPGFHPSLGKQIAAFADRHDLSVIHCHHYSPFVYGCVARLFHPRLRVIFTEHGRLADGPPSPKRRLVNPWLGLVPDSICAVSGALRDSMIEEGFSARRIAVVHNGIETGRLPSESDRRIARYRMDARGDRLVIGTVARLNPVKDLATLIRAFARVRKAAPPATLVIVGDGEERQRLEAAAWELGVAADVRFLGERDDARALLPGFDIFVNSSISEGVSLTILEAMAAELPVVATAVGGTPEVIDDRRTGLLVPARDPDALSRALMSLAGDPAERRVLGAHARAAVERRFTIDRMVDYYAQSYLRLAR
jgi:glycosyltransferase involved in cell wall biosynthesis